MAKTINEIDKCFVSTDCEEIANISQSNGAIIIKRPTDLSQDDSPEWKAWEHAISFIKKINSLWQIVFYWNIRL